MLQPERRFCDRITSRTLSYAAVRLPDGHLSDIANRTRAKDAAQLLALALVQASSSGLEEWLAGLREDLVART